MQLKVDQSITVTTGFLPHTTKDLKLYIAFSQKQSTGNTHEHHAYTESGKGLVVPTEFSGMNRNKESEFRV